MTLYRGRSVSGIKMPFPAGRAVHLGSGCLYGSRALYHRVAYKQMHDSHLTYGAEAGDIVIRVGALKPDSMGVNLSSSSYSM